MHTEKRFDDWEEVEGPQGKKLFVQHVDDFRVIPLGFGRSNYIWNQLVDIYNDWGTLSKGVVRVKRTGTGMYDTSYALSSTSRPTVIPEDKLAQVSDLVDIKSYYKDRYGGSQPSGTAAHPNDTQGVSLDLADDLFG
jgi:hypothetical protein